MPAREARELVDIDLNYVGSVSRDGMLEARPRIEQAIQAVCSREDFAVRRMPTEHAGGKWSLRYPTAAGQSGRIDVDVNYMYRVPLWPVSTVESHPVGSWQATDITVLDIHELAAGKLAALLSRRKARDLFDCRLIFSLGTLDTARRRTAFVVYGAMNRKDWRTVSIEDVTFEPAELSRQLLPSLRAGSIQDMAAADYGTVLADECREAMSALLPFTGAERAFLDRLLDYGEIDATCLTSDAILQQRIQAQPWLGWKAQNVRQYRGLR